VNFVVPRKYQADSGDAARDFRTLFVSIYLTQCREKYDGPSKKLLLMDNGIFRDNSTETYPQ
jgi:hypothetical protein